MKALLATLALVAVAGFALTERARSAQAAPNAAPLRFATLFALDPLRHSISLATGRFGTQIEDQRLWNSDSELEFGTLLANSLSAGAQQGQVGDLLDLGTPAYLAQQWGYQETLGEGQGFASIHLQDGRLKLLADTESGRFQFFTSGQEYLRSARPSRSLPVPVSLGHLYLLRIFDEHSNQLVRLAKLQVVGFQPDQTIDILWQELR